MHSLIVLQAKSHGNEPSKGAKIDQELKEEEEEMLKKKGNFGYVYRWVNESLVSETVARVSDAMLALHSALSI